MRRRGRNSNFIAYGIIVVLLAVSGFLLFTSNTFEREAPQIGIEDEIYWNLKSPLQVKITDNVAVKSVKIVMNDGANDIVLSNQKFDAPIGSLDLNITFPKTGFAAQKDLYTLKFEAVDTSRWGFFFGNKESKEVKVTVDSKKPDLHILNHSYAINKGGTATVVFKANDERLKDVYIESNFGKKFIPTKFYQDDHYASLVAWPVDESSFSADVVAVDLAGNESRSKIRFFYQNRSYRVSKIKLDNQNRFLNEKIPDLAQQYAKDYESMSNVEKMKFVNETLRAANEKLIADATSKISTETISEFGLKKFYPLKNGKAVASFGDHRYYTLGDQEISESWHMGIDLASTQRANIVSSNDGIVEFAGENGIYGQNVIINHGFGVFSLYGHCTSLTVKTGDEVKAGDIIGTTGVSGLAMGDHLHFGMIVQGIEVRPEEWMDTGWMKDNVSGVLNSAKKMISGK
ncbi:M23 family metallopeptidase [Campylobacter sp. CCUG 57310]|uniref:M23 family metallopeptidase n=1 Tax=Campylobacter sp. CCUG 57310 TaxID=2517362 RepID=UPI001564B738|nr:M23 family metallopeptidase [Campylobacter sp. CCUG 57310]QKF92784.1 zinc metallopeptidase, M23 family [Campylobacter sp. CCUG 57310]